MFFFFCCFFSPEAKISPNVTQEDSSRSQLPVSHPPSASQSASQVTVTKCPFLAAQMNDKNSNVFCKASLELQEDVQEMQTVRKGMNSFGYSNVFLCFNCCRSTPSSSRQASKEDAELNTILHKVHGFVNTEFNCVVA